MADRPVRGTPGWLRETNDRTALALLLEHGVLTRTRIGELSGLSKPTAAQMVSRLETAGLIHVVGEVSAGRGPNAAGYAVRTDRMLGVAVDIDATSLRSTIVDAAGAEHPIAVTPLAARTPEADLRLAIDAACSAASVDPERVRAVCVGVQGALDPRTDELTYIETLPGWPKRGIRHRLEDALGIAVHIDNDVNLAAIAERTDGAGRDTAGFALLWMGDGLGLAVDQAGAVHRGASGGAGEIGYLPIPRAAAELDPAAADLQDLIGGPAVAELAAAHGLSGDLLGDEAAREALVAELAARVAVGVVPVLALLDPELVVLGGPTGAACGPRLAELVAAELRDAWGERAVVATGVPTHPVLRGAREHLLGEVREALFDEVSRIAV
ncbi:ROK family transcriptional regulator [Leifsonia shinshuensis]|uniref:Putative NBD/HSP70 family sugar kinase n=1 Tax=Leifsonia shinshuensis TaxID=150026 RepID=A0A853CZL3_9MICO|nr:ROK family transcriptional regulator [Leifsonia shinshuensis]NYJ24751.1 putative NBD/HSP70 family sugar kinase [Leifsonia shinshuensis]